MARPRETLTHRLETADQAWRWVYTRLQTTLEIGERSTSLEVWTWLPEHLELRLGTILTLPTSGAVRWTVLEMGVPYRHGRPTGDYLGQRLPQAPLAWMPPEGFPPAVDPTVSPTLTQTSDRIRDRTARRLETLAEPERRIAWRKAISDALQRRKAAGLPIGRQIQRAKRLQAQLGGGTPPVLPPA